MMDLATVINIVKHKPLPEGWQWVKLGDVCQQDRQIIEPNTTKAESLTYLSLEHIEAESGRILKAPAGEVEDKGKSTTFLFDNRHVLYGKLRSYLNKVALPEFPGRCTTEMIPLLPKVGVSREFLAWILRRRETVDFAMKDKTGSRMPRANINSLFGMEVPLPPLQEQKRIVSILREQMEAVNRARAAAEARLEAARALTASYLRQAFSHPNGLPEGWKYIPLGEVLEFVRNGLNALQSDNHGVPITRIETIANGVIDKDRVKYVEVSEKEYSKYRLQRGDILFSHINSVPHLAKTAIYTGSPDDLIHGVNLLLLRPNSTVDPKYLHCCLQAENIKNIFKAKARQAVNQASLNTNDIIVVPIPVPSLNEQKKIVLHLHEQLSTAKQIQISTKTQLETINNLRAAILCQAFKGEL